MPTLVFDYRRPSSILPFLFPFGHCFLPVLHSQISDVIASSRSFVWFLNNTICLHSLSHLAREARFRGIRRVHRIGGMMSTGDGPFRGLAGVARLIRNIS